MDRIVKALEVARATQGAGARAEAATVIRPICYTQTRVLEPQWSRWRRNKLIAGMDEGEVVSIYKMLRTQVSQRVREQGWRSIAVTSPGPGEGKSLTAANLAISLAREVSQTVLLVDLNLRAPNLHRMFDFTPEFGIADHLLDGVSLANVLVSPGIERLVLLPGRDAVAGSSELLSAPVMAQLAAELSERYASRIVLYDLPPALDTDDVLAFLPNLDAVLLVVEEGRTQRDALVRATNLIPPEKLLGVVLNKHGRA